MSVQLSPELTIAYIGVLIAMATLCTFLIWRLRVSIDNREKAIEKIHSNNEARIQTILDSHDNQIKLKDEQITEALEQAKKDREAKETQYQKHEQEKTAWFHERRELEQFKEQLEKVQQEIDEIKADRERHRIYREEVQKELNTANQLLLQERAQLQAERTEHAKTKKTLIALSASNEQLKKTIADKDKEIHRLREELDLEKALKEAAEDTINQLTIEMQQIQTNGEAHDTHELDTKNLDDQPLADPQPVDNPLADADAG